MVETGPCFAGSMQTGCSHLPLNSYSDLLLTNPKASFISKRSGYEINLP